MKIWIYIGIWCIIIGLSSAVAESLFLLSDTEVKEELCPGSSISAPHARTDRQIGQNKHSNLKVTTLFKVIGGMPDMETLQKKISFEFAIAPMRGMKPVLDKAVVVSSDDNGEFEVELSPGRYWIGPKESATNPDGYDPGGSEIQQIIVEVEAGGMTCVDLLRIDYTP